MSKNTHTLDELLKLIDEEERKQQGEEIPESSPKKEKQKSNINKYAFKFIREFQIKDGDVKYPNYLIFYHFRIWCMNRNYYQKNGLTEFFRTFNKYFKQVRTGRQRYYLLNNALANDEETLKKAKLHNKKYLGNVRGRREKKKQEKSSKISSS